MDVCHHTRESNNYEKSGSVVRNRNVIENETDFLESSKKSPVFDVSITPCLIGLVTHVSRHVRGAITT